MDSLAQQGDPMGRPYEGCAGRCVAKKGYPV